MKLDKIALKISYFVSNLLFFVATVSYWQTIASFYLSRLLFFILVIETIDNIGLFEEFKKIQ